MAETPVKGIIRQIKAIAAIFNDKGLVCIFLNMLNNSFSPYHTLINVCIILQNDFYSQ